LIGGSLPPSRLRRFYRSPAALSRRRFIGYGVSSLALAPVVGWAQGEPSSPPAADTIATATDAAQHLTVNARIDGAGPFRFVVDTGADRTVIADDVAASLGLLHGEQVMLRGIVHTLAAQTVAVRDFSLGPVRRGHMQMPVLPRSMLDADGYLGLDTIDGSRVTFDFKNHALEIGEAHSGSAWYRPRPNETRLRAYGSSGRLRALDCAVAGVTSAAFIDTGAEVSVGNSALLEALGHRHPVNLELGTLLLTGVTGGQVVGRVTTVDRIRLQELEFTDCALVIADLPVFDIWGLGRKPALLIGMNYLRQFARVSIDYGLKEIRFELAGLMVAQPA
jgi:predicted aspartyl protease